MRKKQGVKNNIFIAILVSFLLFFIGKGRIVAQEYTETEKVEVAPPVSFKSEKKMPENNLIAGKIAQLLKQQRENEVVLPLKLGLEIALKNNLDIRIEKIDIPISQKVILEKEAIFDSTLFGEIYKQRYESQTSSALSGTPVSKENELSGIFGIKKFFTTGLEGELFFENSRYRNNSPFEGLDPQYRSFLILNLSQPLLQDFGAEVNMSDVSTAKNDLEISQNKFISRIITILNKTEQTYYDLSRAIKTLRLRQESLALAEELLSGNRKRFKAGVTHIGEVQEAETAVASRKEQVILARQQLRDITNILKNLLQIKPDSPLYLLGIQTEELIFPTKEIPAHDEALRKALSNRPDLRRKKLETENQDIALKFSKNQLLPTLDLVGTFGLNGLSGHAETISFAGLEPSKSPFGGDYPDSLDHLSQGDGYEWQLGLIAEFPLGNRADRSRYNQAKLKKRRSILEFKNLEEKIALEVKIAIENIESNLGRFQVSETFEGLAAKTLHQEEERMKKGLSNTFRLLIFQGYLTDARIRKIQALIDYHKAMALLFKSMGLNYQRHQISLKWQ